MRTFWSKRLNLSPAGSGRALCSLLQGVDFLLQRLDLLFQRLNLRLLAGVASAAGGNLRQTQLPLVPVVCAIRR